MDHIAHLRNIFTCFSISFHKLTIISPCRRALLFIWKNLNFLYKRMIYVKCGSNWPCSSKLENFTIFSKYFYYFAIISPWGRVWAFICKTLNCVYPSMFCFKFGWNWPSSFKGRIFKYGQYNFTISLLPPLWDKLHSRMFCVMFGWNWPTCSCSELEEF